jgi:aminoglycoside phosphotransferase (APT) family kinase protein
MSAGQMPPAEVDIDVLLVRRLLAAQFPQWADLPLEPAGSAGWDNTIYRLGSDLAVRLPRRRMGAGQVEKEHRWLPVLAPMLPLPVPVPLGKGTPAEGYPWRWTVCPWLPGETAAAAPSADPGQTANMLAQFVAALQAVNPAGGPIGQFRGVPLATRDRYTRDAISALPSTLDAGPVIAAWETALAAPPWHGPAVWLHGDLHPANLLTWQGRLSAVIDFGQMGVGDPACDLMVAWTFLSGAARDTFRAALPADDATWARARGWALALGAAAAARPAGNSVLAGIGHHAISEILADHAR